ncbi:MAG: hypothetical protein ACXWB9_04665, partial [Flavisolibacter sp.]
MTTRITCLLLMGLFSAPLYAQHPEVKKIMEGLIRENMKVVQAKCGGEGQGMIISNRGINLF